MTTHRVSMTERTRQQIIAAGANVSTARKGKHGHSSKNRTLLADQKYPLIPRYSFWR